VGLILRDTLHLVESAYRIYEKGTDPADTLLGNFLREFANNAMVQSIDDENALPIHLIGVWDTVGTLGLPWRLRKFSAKHTEYHQFEVPPTVIAARHVLALHELRKPFKLLFWSNRKNHPDLQQVWFPVPTPMWAEVTAATSPASRTTRCDGWPRKRRPMACGWMADTVDDRVHRQRGAAPRNPQVVVLAEPGSAPSTT
jgi:uncharacterized protein (DUF2235 family)